MLFIGVGDRGIGVVAIILDAHHHDVEAGDAMLSAKEIEHADIIATGVLTGGFRAVEGE